MFTDYRKNFLLLGASSRKLESHRGHQAAGGVPEVTRGSRPAHDRRVTRQLDRHHADLIALRRRSP